jgi:putative methyltransferase (TIGR04325 family)
LKCRFARGLFDASRRGLRDAWQVKDKGDRLAVVTQIFPNFASALAACGPGYNDADIADVIAFKTALPVDPRQFAPEQALNSILAVGIAAGETNHRPINVLDFGGGCGFHYFRIVAAIRTPLRWAIVETPTMAERAAKVAQGRFDVFADVAAAAEALGPIDLVHASSAIQYVPDPLATLKTLADLRPRYFALARFPLWGGAQVVGLQTSPLSANGIGPMPPNISDRQVRYPVTFTNFDDVMRTLAGYEIALAMGSPSSGYDVRGQNVQGISVVFRSKELPPTA